MNWDKKSIIAVFVCTLLFMGYMSYLQHKYPTYYAGQQDAEAPSEPSVPAAVSKSIPNTSLSTPSPEQAASSVPAQAAPLSVQDLTFDTATRIIRFDQTLGAIASVQLKQYRHDLKSGDLEELLDSPMLVQGTTQIEDKLGKQGFNGVRTGDSLRLSRVEGPWEIEQLYTIPADGYGMNVKVSFKNTSSQVQELTGGTLIQENIRQPVESGGMFGIGGPAASAATTFVYGLDGKHNDKTLKDLCKDGEVGPAISLSGEKLDYIGIDKHYFLSFLWAKAQPMNYLLARSSQSNSQSCPASLVAWQKFGLVEAGGTVSMDLSGYFGPKQVDVLEAHDPALRSSVKLGWFALFAHPLMTALKTLHGILGNWGLAIILITFLLKALFFPLTRAAAISMKKMQKLQPEMTGIREKFKDDPQRQQRELMAFMSQNKVNPFKGCLPILPQIPVFIAFYNLLSQAIELRHAPFFGWIQDLASRDPYYITPLLLGVGMFLQQKLTPNPGMDKNQEKIMLMMPVVFALMMLSMPAGMVLYMMTNTIVSIAQQQWLNRRLAKQFG
ncbi:MAG: membrane protein insertase YidC [Proteobacteria bacterium]|nr:membrane protein insertase YidC [Pseudomonadota bacterium]